MFELILLLFASYLTGSIPTGIIMGKVVKGIDIREQGSGNAGATNVFRVLGWKYALIVVVFDVFKGWLPVAVYATSLQGLPIQDTGVVQILCGFAAVLGHIYTIFAGFKGGKGVGTVGGLLIALFPTAVPLCLIVFAIALILTGYVSVGSILASISLPIFLFILPPLGLADPASLSTLLIPWFIIFTHRSNISRLRNGNENRFEKAMIFKKK